MTAQFMTLTSLPKTYFQKIILRYGCKNSTWLLEHLLEYKLPHSAQYPWARTQALNTGEKPAGQGYMQIPALVIDRAEERCPLSGRDHFRSFKLLCSPPVFKLRLFLY